MVKTPHPPKRGRRCPRRKYTWPGPALSTPGDRPADWLIAGPALERVLLTATLHQESTSFATQPLEWPDLRWIPRDPVARSW
ncbi:hypothetical protein ACGF8B_10800 [Streptomyces sp. NPDC047917]|uniref:hypothetical protein n=1 Tax=Streptomyces sp. NPDC047917 TaxID=3365491 RepID=UPI00370FC410